MTTTPTVGVVQGIRALPNGSQIGGTTVSTGSGTPNATYVALRIGDLYVDYTNGQVYIASATGSASWVPIGGAGVRIFAFAGIANSTTPNRIGDIGVDYSAGKLYVAGAISASTDWKLVTSA